MAGKNTAAFGLYKSRITGRKRCKRTSEGWFSQR